MRLNRMAVIAASAATLLASVSAFGAAAAPANTIPGMPRTFKPAPPPHIPSPSTKVTKVRTVAKTTTTGVSGRTKPKGAGKPGGVSPADILAVSCPTTVELDAAQYADDQGNFEFVFFNASAVTVCTDPDVGLEMVIGVIDTFDQIFNEGVSFCSITPCYVATDARVDTFDNYYAFLDEDLFAPDGSSWDPTSFTPNCTPVDDAIVNCWFIQGPVTVPLG